MLSTLGGFGVLELGVLHLWGFPIPADEIDFGGISVFLLGDCGLLMEYYHAAHSDELDR